MEQILKEYDGKVRLVFKDLPLPIHNFARAAHEAARCAGARGKYWPYHDRLFEEQPRFERERLIAYAVDLGLDRAEFTRCMDERTHAAAVDRDLADARALGIKSTPTFLVNGQALVGAHPLETFRLLIDDALGKGRR
ncbi:MAG: thioredoxin domain-containing protein [Candidatus Rokubacteria bacterium]|nr:thioredoxin domain-containing protein [Candidatus Rokubacteria bacterium]